jgi:dihydrofolate synthase/folylpolyglutamate synthase
VAEGRGDSSKKEGRGRHNHRDRGGKKGMITVGILTMSDKGARGEREDLSGQEIKGLVAEIPAEVKAYEVIPDEKYLIKDKLIEYADDLGLDIIITTGGTGVSPRDVTPDATLEVIDKEIPGMAEVMRYESLKKTARAMMSRAVVGVRGRTLIINLPGSPKGVRENLSAILPAISHAVEKIKGDQTECAQAMSYQETLSYLYGLQKFGIKLGLSNISNLLDLLGNPQERLRSVHIAGTNGKGSTAATIATILQEGGYKVGLYTSPHLINFTERIKINGCEIDESRVGELTERIRSRIRDSKFKTELEKITFFEFTTAMSLLYFSEEGVEIAVMETGMGGRLDATNVVRPLVSVITNISLDHKEFLGETIGAIAYEKGGIIKDGIPVVTGVEQPEAFEVIENICSSKGASLYRLGRDFSFKEKGMDTFSYSGIREGFDDLRLTLRGWHQFINASIAIAAVELLREKGLTLTRDAVSRGLLNVSWPGRLETVSQNPWIILDGAHNPAGAQALSRVVAKELKFDKLYLILGIMADKEIEGIVSPLAPLADEVILSRPGYERASSAEALLPVARRYNGNARAFEDLRGAIDYAKSKAGERDLIVISGSLFTVGEARAIIRMGD